MTLDINQLKIGDRIPVPPKPKSETEIMESWKGDLDQPLVSIVCHTFNHVNYLEVALNGFLMQETDFPFEIILHDDASTDGTTEIVRKYSEAYPNIIVPIVQSENQYIKGKRPSQVTFPTAKGRYIALCEGDDYWLDKNKVEKQLALLNSTGGTALSFHDALCIDQHGKFQGMNKSKQSGYSSSELKKAPFIPTLTRFFVNKDLKWFKNTPLPIAMDVVLTSYLSRFGGAIHSTDVIPSVYRFHDNGVWSLKTKLEKVRLSTDAMLYIAMQYEKEFDLEGQRYFLQRAYISGLEKISIAESLSILYGIIRYITNRLVVSLVNKVKLIIRGK